ncbi:hypothetical protein EMIT0P43_10116 [Pseudomonas jessenii]
MPIVLSARLPVECNGGKESKAKASGKSQKVVLEVAD